MGDGINLKGLMGLFNDFTYFNTGTPEFFKKIERLLAQDITRKKHQLDEQDLTLLLRTLARRRCANEMIWQALLKDWEELMDAGAINNIHIFYLLRAMDAAGLQDPDVTKSLIDYIVKRGYDSDDLQLMSSSVGGYRRAVHFIQLVADNCPKLKNKHFLTHI